VRRKRLLWVWLVALAGAALLTATSVWALTAEQEAKLLASDGAESDYFGYSVALDGDTAMIGAPTDYSGSPVSGSVFVFARSAGEWSEQAELLPDDGAAGDRFGHSVALDGDSAIVGAIQDDDNGENSGSAYVLIRAAGVWTEQAKLLASDGADLDRFGASVALDGDTAVVGATTNDDNGY